ncbi:MAG: hypothetical protein ACRDJF_09405 [Actinomycetota bacterium]
MAKRKTTIYLDDQVLRAAKVFAARMDKRESQVMEEALRSYLGLGVLEAVWRRSQITDTEALALAYEELHAARRERRDIGE